MTKPNCIAKLNWMMKMCGVFLLWAAAALALPAQTFTTLHSFDYTDGSAPYGALVQGADGNFYGTTLYGGANDSCASGDGCGTIFKITSNGALTSLYNFCSQGGCTGGELPEAGLAQGPDGNFYGTTDGGGANDSCADEEGCGTAFKITSTGTLTTLSSFCSREFRLTCIDGYGPSAGLVQGIDGSFYGTTQGGGSSSCVALYGCGTVFKITQGGMRITLHKFKGADGAYPEAGLVQGTDGSFYGTTSEGGAHTCDFGYGCGTVFNFKMTPNGILTTLYSFDGTDGVEPMAGLIQGTDGSFYGTTDGGGANGFGTVFKITPGGMLTTLYSFCPQSGCPDGSGPEAGLVLGTDGNFYGTTSEGEPNDYCLYGCGTIFTITPSGTLTTLHTFTGADGERPVGVLLQDTNGIFYGTTASGGEGVSCGFDGCGTVFSLAMGLGPFVRTNPVAGKVGSNVGILGTDVTGATGVKFNGTETAFRLVSSTFIEAKVPSGATTGKVEVQLPNGTLSSNVPFIVLR